MVELGDDAGDRALWRRWYAGTAKSVPQPDVMILAAYAEGRLSETEAAPVEAWLALHPAALDDVIAARDMTLHPPRIAFATIVTHASALVDGATPTNVVSLRHAVPRWRNALAWSGIAASLAVASLGGFAMGNDAYASLATPQVFAAGTTESFDTPTSLDSLVDDSGT